MKVNTHETGNLGQNCIGAAIAGGQVDTVNGKDDQVTDYYADNQ